MSISWFVLALGAVSIMEHNLMWRIVVQVARKMAASDEQEFVDRMQKEMVENYYPGLSINIEKDFPKLEEQKFWARIFFETAREIFERKIGIQDYLFWQSQRIYQIYGTGNIFTKAVRDIEPNWFPNTVTTVSLMIGQEAKNETRRYSLLISYNKKARGPRGALSLYFIHLLDKIQG